MYVDTNGKADGRGGSGREKINPQKFEFVIDIATKEKRAAPTTGEITVKLCSPFFWGGSPCSPASHPPPPTPLLRIRIPPPPPPPLDKRN